MSEQENRVGQYARRVGEILGLEPETLLMLELAGSLHDVGKEMISERIVDKPGPLTDAEWEAMRKHPELGEAFAREEGHPKTSASGCATTTSAWTAPATRTTSRARRSRWARASSPCSTRTSA